MKRLFVMGLLFMFMAVAPVVSLFAAEPEVATNSGPISSVTVAGLVEQNGTPTPTTPIDIVSNNGVLKVSKNLAPLKTLGTSVRNIDAANGAFAVDVLVSSSSSLLSSTLQNLCPSAKPGDTLYMHYESQQSPDIYIGPYGSGILWGNNTAVTVTETMLSTQVRIGGGGDTSVSRTFNITNFYIGKTPFSSFIPYGEVYTDGTVETIADSANHTATVATLLGVGDYRDTQNINTGAITRNVGVKVLDGTENWTYATSSNYERFVLTESGLVNDNAHSILLATHYEAFSANSVYAYKPTKSCWIEDGKSIRFHDNSYTSVDSWKAYLADQYAAGTPVIVIYPLETATTESVAGQTMTTAPVNNRTGGVTGMTITTLLSSGASVVTTIAANAIKIATTAYNAARFSPVVTDLNSAVATIREIVTKTINQTAAIASLQADKQTRPEDACPAGKKCLLVETEENGVIVPHWFPIIEAPENTE